MDEPDVGGPGDVWRLERAGRLVCEVVVDELDDAVLRGRLLKGPSFAEAAPLFAAEAGAERDGDGTRRRQAIEEINRRFRLIGPHGPVETFTFLVRGDRAGFRWAD